MEDGDTLTYAGHATALLRVGETTVVTDPFLRRNLGPLRRHGPVPSRERLADAGVVLISHLHRDHLDLRSLRRLPTEAPVVLPRGAARLLGRGGRPNVVELAPGESTRLAGLEITATPAIHDGHRDRWGEQIEPLGFVIDSGPRRVYFAGDTDLFDGMAEIDGIDLALLPVWGWGPTLGGGHLDPESAAQAVELLGPRLAVPIHWGTIYPFGLRMLRPGPLREPPREFARQVAERAPDVEVRILEPGEKTGLE